MRFLKNKIALATHLQNTKQPQDLKGESKESERKKRKKIPGSSFTSETSRATKNIVKNYGKALCAFASSKLARPYIDAVIAKKGYEGVNKQKFMEQMKEKKETTNSMESLRRLLMESSEDNEEDVMFKTIFKEVSIIFMKYFSVNWIYSGKLVHKNAHLKFRFKMLRRIKNPEFFTYLN